MNTVLLYREENNKETTLSKYLTSLVLVDRT